MIIDKELLSEKNYAGTRLIEIVSPKVKELNDIVSEYQKEANPILEEMEKITPLMDPIFAELAELEQKKKEVQSRLAPIREPYDELLQKIEKIDQKATLVKNKIQPLIAEELKGQLGEFEIARHTVVKDGKIFVEVYDEIEEKVKAIRASKPKI